MLNIRILRIRKETWQKGSFVLERKEKPEKSLRTYGDKYKEKEEN